MIEFIHETLPLLPLLFLTYVVLEAVEAKAGGALERILERSHSVGPAVGALAGAFPQCGASAISASAFAGGMMTAGTLLAVLLSTSDELIPVLVSARAPAALVAKIVGIKIVCAAAVGFLANGLAAALKFKRRQVSMHELCEHSHCGCHRHGSIVKAALKHSLTVFVFIVAVSGAIELGMHWLGEGCLESLRLNRPVTGELAGGLLGLVPNCAISVAGAKLYLEGAMSGGALMASSFTGAGVGLLVLFRTNRSLRENLAILLITYAAGVLLGGLAGRLL